MTLVAWHEDNKHLSKGRWVDGEGKEKTLRSRTLTKEILLKYSFKPKGVGTLIVK